MTCLKCGRTVPEGTLLCQECRARKKPVAYAGPALTDEERLRRQVGSLLAGAGRRKRWIVLLAALCILTLAASIGAGYLLRRQSSRINEQETSIAALESANSAVRGELDESNALNDTLSEKLSQAQRTIEAYYRRTGLNPEELDWPPAP